MVRRAAIDIGTNSTRLLIADQHEDGNLRAVQTDERITRLGHGVGEDGALSQDGIGRVIDAVREYAALICRMGAADCSVFATSAVRDAPNRKTFIRQFADATGLEVQIVSGDREARLAYLGAVSDLSPASRTLVCDIGGGSTELIYAESGGVRYRRSLDIGSRRLTTAFLSENPCKKEIRALEGHLHERLAGGCGGEAAADQQSILVGGTATTLAMMDAKVDIRTPALIHHRLLARERLDGLIERLGVASIEQKRAMIGLHPDRADVILTGALIVRSIYRHFNLQSAVVSLRNGLYGIMIERNARGG